MLTGVEFGDYVARWNASVPAPAQAFRYGTVVEGGRDFDLVGLRLPGARTVLITAGFHGDEKAGPLTLLEHAAEIVAYAAARGVGLLIYPCINPSGFEAHTRYNVTGERPNNDFLRYEIAPGVWRGELRDGEQFSRIAPAVDGLPKETAALARELDRAPAPRRVARSAPGQLHPRGALLRLRLRRSGGLPAAAWRARASLVPVLRSSIVDSGYEPGSDVRADAEGFIICPDGSITDKFHRAGVPYVAAIETTTETPGPLSDEINLIWIRGFIDLCAV